MSRVDFDRVADRLRNWGRWGSEDSRGTLNHIGPEALKRGANSVKQGKLFTLGLSYDVNGPRTVPFRDVPRRFATALAEPIDPRWPDNYCYADDIIHMPLQSATHWDALCHVHYDGLLYNGHCVNEHVRITDGAKRCGVEHMACPGIASRGVLLDIARLRGVEALPTDFRITPDDLNEACDAAGVIIESGDIVLVRTGHIRHFIYSNDIGKFSGAQSGVAVEVAEWLHDNSVAAIASDNLAVESLGNLEEDRYDLPLPFHMLMLRDMGCPLGEMFNLEELANSCAQDGQYTFLLSAPPLAFTGGFGSPVNPQALK